MAGHLNRTLFPRRAGQMAPETGIYSVVHLEHRHDHKVTMIRGEEFPECRVCKSEVSFYLVCAVTHVTHDFDFSGPRLRLLKSGPRR
jgi:hypothetical protein